MFFTHENMNNPGEQCPFRGTRMSGAMGDAPERMTGGLSFAKLIYCTRTTGVKPFN
jgi:hypothetical protein